MNIHVSEQPHKGQPLVENHSRVARRWIDGMGGIGELWLNADIPLSLFFCLVFHTFESAAFCLGARWESSLMSECPSLFSCLLAFTRSFPPRCVPGESPITQKFSGRAFKAWLRVMEVGVMGDLPRLDNRRAYLLALIAQRSGYMYLERMSARASGLTTQTKQAGTCATG